MALRRMALALLIVPVAALGSWRLWHQNSAVPDVVIVQAHQGDLCHSHGYSRSSANRGHQIRHGGSDHGIVC